MKFSSYVTSLVVATCSGVALAQTCDEWAYLDSAPAVAAYAVSFDPTRGTILAFAPIDPPPANARPGEIFEIRDGVWTRVLVSPTTQSPFLRTSAMAFDEARGVMVLTGGATLELVDGVWTPRGFGLQVTQIAFDARSRKLVAVLGSGQVREWNGSTWAPVVVQGRTPLNPPVALAYNRATDELWAFSDTAFYVLANEVWGRSTPAPWPAADRPILARFDDDDQRIHVITSFAEYSWTGIEWESAPLSGWPGELAPGGRSAAWDPLRGEVVVVTGGEAASFGAVRTLVLRHRTWVPYRGVGRQQHLSDGRSGLVYDESRDRMIASDSLGSVEIRGERARVLDSRPMLPLAYDPLRRVVVGDLSPKLYELSEETWTESGSTFLGVPSRAVSYDARRGRVVALDGRKLLSLEGSDWVSVAPLEIPELRNDWWIEFEPVRRYSLLSLTTTTTAGPMRAEVDGQTPSILVDPLASIYGVDPVYDPNRGGIVAVGGFRDLDRGGSTFPHVTRLLRSGSGQWETIGPSLPLGNKLYASAYDTLRQRIVIWGGLSENGTGGLWGPTLAQVLGYGPAAIVRQPSPSAVQFGQTIELRVVAKGGGQVQYRWRKDGVDIHDTLRRAGTAREVMTIDDARSEDLGSYDVVVFNPCGTEKSVSVVVGLCPSDFNADGAVDADDTIAFFGAWESGSADVNGDGDTDGDDVIAFFARWDAGC